MSNGNAHIPSDDIKIKRWIPLAIAGGLFLIYKLITKGLYAPSVALALLPVVFVFIYLIVQKYARLFYVLFCSHFIILIMGGFVDLPLGIFTFSFNIIIIAVILLISVYKSSSWKNSYNGMFILYCIWGVFCVAELGNPNTVQAAWNLAITYYFAYPILCAIIIPFAIRTSKNVQWLLFLWSVFIIAAALKGYWQKSHGFTSRELFFLYELGGARTHIIWSGIRYFSFFTDAANYGVHMAMGVLGFAISTFLTKNKWLKVYFSIVTIAAVYGMGISGTRSAMAVPIGGLLYFIFLSRNWKAFFIGIFTLLSLFAFFRLTTIGESNEYIRKMRSAFKPKEDASYIVRVENRQMMKEYMKYKPIGYGLGLGGKAERFAPKELMPLPPDSWLVNVWTDTGIIGIILYLLLHGSIFIWCSWIIMFKIRDKRLKGLLIPWLCVNAGFFIAAYTNDVMQYPNIFFIYTGFALCFAGPAIEKNESNNLVHES